MLVFLGGGGLWYRLSDVRSKVLLFPLLSPSIFFKRTFVWAGNYIKIHNAIKRAYPDIKIISNCDGSSRKLDHPADYYDFHVTFLKRRLFFLCKWNIVYDFRLLLFE